MRVFDAAVAKAYGGKRKIALAGGLRRREGLQEVQQLAARRDGRGVPGVPRRHQGPAHHAGRRRHPLAQRGAAPDARPLRLPAPGALVQGRAAPGEAPREGRHGHLPREHRGHLRGHRVGGGLGGGEEVARVPREGVPKEFKKIRFPESAGIGIKPVSREGTERLVRAAIDYALEQQAQERDPRAQGQHHEVHRGRVPRLGLRARRARVRRQGRTPGSSGSGPRRRRARRRPTPSRRRRSPRASSWSRTRSPTSRSSRCSRAPRSSTSSPR